MKNLTRSLQAGLKGFKEGYNEPANQPAAKYKAGSHSLRCLQCKGDLFSEREIGVMWPGGAILTCDACGLSQFYGKKPSRSEA